MRGVVWSGRVAQEHTAPSHLEKHMEIAPSNIDARYNRAFMASCTVTEQQMRAAAEIILRSVPNDSKTVDLGLLGAITQALAANFAALNNTKAA